MKTPNHHRSPDPRYCRGLFDRGERGFTLVELMIVVVIMGILLGAAIPSFRSMVITMRIKNASFDVYSSIVAARSEAITRNTTITITPASGTTDWAPGWVVTVGGVAVKTQNAFPGVTITGPATLVYNSSGRLATAVNCPAASPPNVCISLTAANAFTQDGRCVNIDLSGRPVTAKGVCP